MKKQLPYWGSLKISGLIENSEKPLRRVIDDELAESRAFADFLYREFNRIGRRTLSAKLFESKGRLPWPMPKKTS